MAWARRHWKGIVATVLTALLLIGMGIRFRDYVVCRVAEYFLKTTGVLPSDLTVRCASSSISFRELNCSGVKVSSQSDPHFTISSDECTVTFFSRPHGLYPSPHITLEGLHVSLPHTLPKKEKKSVPLKKLRTIYALGSYFTVESGMLHVEEKRVFPFSFSECEKHRKLIIFHDKEEAPPLFTFSMEQERKELNIKGECSQFDMQSLSSFPLLLQHGIVLSQGVIDGRFRCVMNGNNEIELLTYGFSMKGVAAKVGAFHIGANEIVSYRSAENLGPSFLDAEWQLTDCFVSKEDANGKQIPLIKDVRANLPSRKGDLLTVKGSLKHWGGFHPVYVQGMRDISEQGTHIEMRVTSEPFSLNGELKYNRNGAGFVKGDFAQCDVFLIEAFLKDFVSSHLPSSISFPNIRSGLFSGSAYVRLHEWKLDTLEVEQLSLEKFQLFSKDFPSGIEGDELQCFFRYAGGEIPSWGIHLQNVSFPDVNITHCGGDFAIHERYVIPSSMYGHIDGMKIKASVRGVLPSLKIALETSGGCAPFFSTFVPNHSLTKNELGKITSFAVNASVQMRERSLSLRGNCVTRALAHCDVVEFQGNFLRPNSYSLEALRHAFQEVTFSGKNISAVSLNLPLGIAGQPWRLRGKSSFEGGVTEQGLAVTFQNPQVSFISPVLKAEVDSVQKEASISYSFEEKKWAGTIPVSGASVTLPKNGLCFTGSTGDVIIQGKEVYIKTMRTSFKDLQVEGRMAVHFPEDDEVNIELITTQLEGQVGTLQQLLVHFDDFKDLSLPITGRVTQERGKGLRLKATLSENEPRLKWGADLRVYEGVYPLTETLAAEEITLDIEWNGVSGDVSVSNINGVLKGVGLEEPLVCRGAKFSLKDDMLDTFSFVLENETHAILSMNGRVAFQDGAYALHIENPDAHLYSLPLSSLQLVFDREYSIEKCLFSEHISEIQLNKIVMLVDLLGIVPHAREITGSMMNNRLKLDPLLSLSYHKQNAEFSLQAAGSECEYNEKKYGPWSLSFAKTGKKISACSFEMGSFSLSSRGNWEGARVTLDSLEIKRKKAYAKLSALTFDYEKAALHCSVDKLYAKLEELKEDFPTIRGDYQEYLTGAVTCTGEVFVDFTNGYKKPIISGTTDIIAPKIGKGEMQLVSHHPIAFHIDPDEGVRCEAIELLLSTLDNEDHWAQIECATFFIQFATGTYSAERMRALIPPEMFLFIARTESIPYVFAAEKSIKVYGIDIPWENQVDISASFQYEGSVLTCKGIVKDGYYWIGNTSLFIHDVAFSLGKESATFSANMDAYKQPVGLTVEASFAPTFSARVALEDKRAAEKRLNDSRTILSANLSEDNNGKINIKSIQGGIYGIDIAFQQQSHRTTDKELVLSGKLRCHMPYVATILPPEIQGLIETAGMGKGYEISGDVTLNWDDLHGSTFAGYIKGKNFELLNARIQTLMGTLRISKNEISIDRFTISDEAGQLSINEIQCIKGEDGKWRLTIPQIALQDFRPSLLRYIGKYRGKMKPLVVRDLHFQDITGELGNAASFTGNGNLHFTNTFKKEYNLLDIPFELIARLGIDMGLLVPIRGKLEYEIKDGKIYLIELSESCSEGKRSKFYLSKSSPSYISLRGDINVSIKMKQYVILKVTEPFILSITGTVKKPKYSLR